MAVFLAIKTRGSPGDTGQMARSYRPSQFQSVLSGDFLFPIVPLSSKLRSLDLGGTSEQILKTESWKERFRIGKSPLGRAVYARRQFRKGQKIGEIRGKVIDDPDHSSCYGIDLGPSRQLEPIAPFRFLNHSCEPNCEIAYSEDDGEENSNLRLWVQAVSTIRLGDELVIDYGWPAQDAIECGCGANSCRGWVVSVKELPKLLKQKRLEKKPSKKTPVKNKRRKLAKR
jgi:uncharacterized protein